MSKELEALEEIRYLIVFDEDCVDEEGDRKPIKVFVDEVCPKQYKTIEKSLKALEIIKELPDKYKEGLVYILLGSLNERKISQKDYDLLKEVLL